MKATVRAHAKLNLTLDIVGKRDDDYHLLESVMQSVSLHDVVTVKTTDSGDIEVDTSDDRIADDHSNIAYRAACAFFDATGIRNPGLDIRIKKRIPIGAGMAGGSADGAAVLIALNDLFDTELSEDALCDIAEQVGADVPFCVTGGTMLARGTGNILDPLPDLDDCYFVIAKPELSVSTAEAYRAVDLCADRLQHPDSEAASEDICAQDLKALARHLGNAFERALKLEDTERLRKALLAGGALGACMTGSGSAVFGIFEDRDDANRCADDLEDSCECVFVAQPVSRGCFLDD